MPEENTVMEQQTTIETEDDSEESRGIPGKLIVGVIGIVGGAILFLKKKLGGKKYAVVEHGRFGRTGTK